MALGRHVRDRKVVYLGETHGEPAVVGLHTAVLNTLVTQVQDFNKSRRTEIQIVSWCELKFASQAEERGSDARVSVFMEHFSLEHQV